MKDRPRDRNFCVEVSMGVSLEGLRMAHMTLACVREGLRNCSSIRVRSFIGMLWLRSVGAMLKREGQLLRLACVRRVSWREKV